MVSDLDRPITWQQTLQHARKLCEHAVLPKCAWTGSPPLTPTPHPHPTHTCTRTRTHTPHPTPHPQPPCVICEAGSLDNLHEALLCMLDNSSTDGSHVSPLCCVALQL